MYWFQSTRRVWAALGLVGLALQLALSFGHVHGRPNLRPESIAAPAINSSLWGPSDHSDHEDDYCATCAILTLLAGAQTSSAPQAPPKVFYRSAEIAFVDQIIRTDTATLAFHSRAPPHA
jgi:hypothetical protein